jgi:sulfoxide reductase heme-binding subunit YedZ
VSIQRWIKVCTFVLCLCLCLLPFFWLSYGAVVDRLGPDAAKAVMLFSGEWSLRLLAVTLLVSPLPAWTGWSVVMRLRRMLGCLRFSADAYILSRFCSFIFVGMLQSFPKNWRNALIQHSAFLHGC